MTLHLLVRTAHPHTRKRVHTHTHMQDAYRDTYAIAHTNKHTHTSSLSVHTPVMGRVWCREKGEGLAIVGGVACAPVVHHHAAQLT